MFILSYVEPVPLKRVFFWTAFVIGTLAFIYGLLLTQVPRGRNTDFRLDLAIWGSCSSLLLICLLLMKRMSSAKYREAAWIFNVRTASTETHLAFRVAGSQRRPPLQLPWPI